MQTIITPKGYKKESEVERLERIRQQYYTALIEQLNILKYKKTSLIKDYNNTSMSITAQIDRIKNNKKKIVKRQLSRSV
jgi:hypothetical protein